MDAEDGSSTSPVSVGVECCRCVDKFVVFKKGTPCRFYVSMFGFRKANDCGGCFTSCEDVLKIE